jgi:hypothetical protein
MAASWARLAACGPGICVKRGRKGGGKQMCTSTVASNAACGPSISRNLAVRWRANHAPQLSGPAVSSKSAQIVGCVWLTTRV